MRNMKASLALCASVAAIGATNAHAQTAPASTQTAQNTAAQNNDGIADIVVTAQRRAESAQRTPLAITAIGADVLKRSGVLETADLAAVVPNMQIISPFGRSQPNIALRGISIANEYNPNQASPIGVYVDDGYLPSRTSHGMQLFDLERVEVLSGPQGTLYGRNTTGGAVNFITMKPQFDGDHGSAEVGYGNFNRVEASGMLNLVVVPDKLAIRGAIDYVNSDGMVKSTNGGPAIQSENSIGGRISVLAKPAEGLKVLLKFYTGDAHPIGNANLAIGTGPDGANGLTGYASPGGRQYIQSTGDMGKFKFHASGFLGNVSYQSGDLTFTSNTSYDWGGRNLQHDTSDSPTAANTLYINWADNFKDFNQELRVNYAHGPVKLVLGGYYGWDKVDVNNVYNFYDFLKPLVPFDIAVLAGGPASAFAIDSSYTQVRRSKAIFEQTDVDLVGGLSATLGLRYTWDNLNLRNDSSNMLNYSNVPVYNLVPGTGVTPPTSLLATSNSYHALSGKIGLNYKFSPTILAFVSASKGYRAGAVNAAGYLTPAQVSFVAPETVYAYEAGLKSDLLDRKLRINLSTFYYDYRNQQLEQVIGPVAFLVSAPKADIYGAEAEITGKLTRDLTLNVNAGLLHTEYKDLTLSGVDLSGNRLPFAPKFTGSVGLDWTAFHLANGDTISTDMHVSYSSQQWFSPFNAGPSSATGAVGTNINQQQKAYALVNAQVEYKGSRFFGSVWVKNMFNQFYTVFGLDLRSAFGFDYLAMGSPRTFGVTGGVKF